MVDFGQLLSIDLSKIEAFADSWNNIQKRIEEARSDFKGDVLTPLENEDWKGEADGTFSTGWQDSAPNVDNGAKSRNWYYALNNFEYRVVGEKNGDETSYHVEVRKNYDWGIPSEGRGNLKKGPVELEQADIAHLHSTGMARDLQGARRDREDDQTELRGITACVLVRNGSSCWGCS